MNILDHDVLLDLFRNNYLFFVCGVALGAFLFTFYTLPKVLWVSHEKKLTKQINGRSSHHTQTPNFGGVAFFLVFVLFVSVLQSIQTGYTGNHLIAGMTLLFLVGLKDDLVISTAKVKLLGQITAALFIIFSPELHLSTLHGFLGIHEVPELIGYFLKAFLVVALINAYNLVDGIDGLAAIVGMIICTAYACVFYITGHPYFVLLGVTVAGTLAAYLRFNFSRGKRKMFMGDSGSLIIGFMIAFLTLKVLVMEPGITVSMVAFSGYNRILLILAILFIPILDTGRVMILRMLGGKSPFEADRNHAHHVLLDLGFTHWQASTCLGGLNIFVIVGFFLLSGVISASWVTVILLLMFIIIGALLNILRSNAELRTFVKEYA
ncbi:MraY family glycosyltransferase [Zunongwangia sp. F260]|uniref:MraY family glycosyltransferase n=1 Tax=Autumnicola lenta TaxID=3075593 RepID=A0ABU3CM75_9FLAO|nr:MraY family glycosyltransferase [Zunongwangia sp. F260]MDT0647450.1 MraY family glycosyltransferase [Zunongwangia sp. F260]